MAYIQDVFPIVQKKNLAKNIFDLTISCPHIAAEAVPGQFVHVKVPDSSSEDRFRSVESTK